VGSDKLSPSHDVTFGPTKKLSYRAGSNVMVVMLSRAAFNCLRPQKDKKACRAHELARVSQESTAAYHFPLQNKLGEDKEKRRGLTAVADD
jgi:hypothetical protein